MSSITDINTVNVESGFKFLPVRVLNSGGKSVGIQNKSLSKKVVIKSPLMLTWGLSDYEGNEQYKFSLQFPGNDFLTPKTKTFLDQMMAFEEMCKAGVLLNSKEWMGKKLTPEVLDALWTPMLKYPKTDGEIDTTRSPTLPIKVPRYDGKWACEVYDHKGNCVFDPNDTEQLCKLLEEKFFNGGRLLKFSLGHKYELMRVLGIALADTDYDFETIIHHQDDYFCLPWSWEIKSPRSFFETIYLKMYEHWGRELIADGFDLAKPEELFV